jgi:hypothetical protein
MIPIPSFLRGPNALVFGAGVALLSGSVLVAAFATTQMGPLLVNDAHDAYAIQGLNTSTTGIGVEGRAAAGSGGIGVAGTNSSSGGIGTEGLSTGTSGIGVYARGTGYGVYGLSQNSGVLGSTTSSSTTLSSTGIYGVDQSTAGAHDGVAGITANASGTGVYAGAKNGGTGIYASSDSGNALYAQTNATQTMLGGSDLYGDSTAVIGNANFQNGFNGVEGLGVYGVAAYALGTQPYGSALYLESDNGQNLMEAFCVNNGTCPGSAGVEVMSLDQTGNMNLTGKIIASNIVQTTSSATMANVRRETYATTAATPTLEDSGEAALVGGVANVRLDPALVDSMDHSANYLVLITPKGDTEGWLYVAAQTQQGFVVREHGNGRSNVTFDYRVVSRPAGERSSARLPLLKISNDTSALARIARGRHALPHKTKAAPALADAPKPVTR